MALLKITLVSAVLATSSAFAASDALCVKKPGAVRLSVVGDVLPHKVLYQFAIGQKDRFRSLWSELIPALKAADWTAGNLEGPVAPGTTVGGGKAKDVGWTYDGNVYSGTNFVFNYHPQVIKDLQVSGFDFLTLANNHTLDRGGLGIDRTIDQMELAGMPYVGIRKKGSTQPFERIVQVKDLTLGVVSCTEMTNGWKDKNQQLSQCGSSLMIESIKRLKTQTDLVVVMPHWGDEYQLSASGTQKRWARQWVNAGATLILGSHPHVLQPKEWLKDASGRKALVFYSMGNFIAAQRGVERSASAIAHIDLRKTKDGVSFEGYSYTPIYRPPGSASVRLVGQKGGAYEAARTHVRKQLGSYECF